MTHMTSNIAKSLSYLVFICFSFVFSTFALVLPNVAIYYVLFKRLDYETQI